MLLDDGNRITIPQGNFKIFSLQNLDKICGPLPCWHGHVTYAHDASKMIFVYFILFICLSFSYELSCEIEPATPSTPKEVKGHRKKSRFVKHRFVYYYSPSAFVLKLHFCHTFLYDTF